MSQSTRFAATPELASHDPVWDRMRAEAQDIVEREPELSGFLLENVLNHATLEDAVVHRLADRLDHPALSGALIRQTYRQALGDEPVLGEIFRVDIMAVVDRDPACDRVIEPVLYFKGFHALQAHRLANWLWRQGRQDFALYLQSRTSEVFQVDIHPQVPVGRGIFIDHATGVVVGSTAVIEDDVSILQGVTLGGTGKTDGDRHPKVRRGVLIGAGAEILGNFELGHCSRIAAGSVVLAPVPPNTTVAGVPARIVGTSGCAEPARSMDQLFGEKPEKDES
ncbi:serine O-acetyltransferase [Breoghania corrubedonensis]|uniref:Serine acetyltransferase n=1 Tax=Breoghania corrubedonensis TaxID=665038 RepID=A0A2T5VD47_9HYPH|nr:serine O-acetyltransferase [Breoghania corrubedonensis]PTW61655.1 serine O-acetyltransferase [Breoghania corrubedonensis]